MNSQSCRLVAAFLMLTATSLQAAESPAEPGITFFENRIRPVLVQHCYACHSGSAKSLKGGLRLDLRDTTRRGGDSGPAIVRGKPDKSLLIEALRYETLEMPPKGKLPARVIADFVKWIEMGAPDPRIAKPGRTPQRPEGHGASHWAFQPVRLGRGPEVAAATWPGGAVDRFILHRLEQQGLSPVRDADRYQWLRRVSFDLTGLPPTVEEIRQFAADESPLAFARVVDRLLASRAFGERWARHWLDLVGYADQIGTSNNVFAEHAWRYRDYVIDSLIRDVPFDRFIREQIAGDQLADGTAEERAAALTATGFLVLGDLEIVEADKAKLHVDIIDQQVVKTSTAFLGMTVGCARCHDHKFDPIAQRDYYALAGFFHSSQTVFKTERGVWSDVITRELPETEAQQRERQQRERRHTARIANWQQELKTATKRREHLEQLAKRDDTSEADRKKHKQERDQLAGRIGQLKRDMEHAEFFAPTIPKVYGVQDVEQPADMRMTIRGNPRALADSVPRGFLGVISAELPTIPQSASGRRQLADWIASPDNPLTARVAVNRIWQRLFGQGLVRSVDYFGVRGEAPSHPALLDFLAASFVRNGWSRKRLIRALVLSRTYRMSSAHDPQADRVDPENRLLWRMNRRRLDAEALRDAMLAVSGRLLTSSGGPAMPLEFPENVANIDPKNVNPPSFRLVKWRPSQAVQRTVYLPILRSVAQPGPAELRNVFDFTQPAEFAGQRATTAVPTQALFLMNSAVVRTHARELATRLDRDVPEDDAAQRLGRLWLLVLNRPISTEEVSEANAFVAGQAENGWTELCHALLASNEFLMRL